MAQLHRKWVDSLQAAMEAAKIALNYMYSYAYVGPKNIRLATLILNGHLWSPTLQLYKGMGWKHHQLDETENSGYNTFGGAHD